MFVSRLFRVLRVFRVLRLILRILARTTQCNGYHACVSRNLQGGGQCPSTDRPEHHRDRALLAGLQAASAGIALGKAAGVAAGYGNAGDRELSGSRAGQRQSLRAAGIGD